MRRSFGSAFVKGVGGAVDIQESSFGRINSSLPITTTTISDESVVGTIGNGNCRTELVNSNGSITIERE